MTLAAPTIALESGIVGYDPRGEVTLEWGTMSHVGRLWVEVRQHDPTLIKHNDVIFHSSAHTYTTEEDTIWKSHLRPDSH